MDTNQPLAGVDADLLERARDAAAGYPELEDVLNRLDSLHEVDPSDLPGEYDTMHRSLRTVLGDTL